MTEDSGSRSVGAVQTPPRFDVLGVHISATTLDETLAILQGWLRSGTREYVCVCDVNSLLAARDDPELLGFYNASGLTVPDGMPLVWAGQAAGLVRTRRVCGPDLLPAMLSGSVEQQWSHYFLGGAPGIAERIEEKASTQFPGIKLAGHYCPPFREPTPEEDLELIGRINESGADIVWVGLGAPKQERWMASHRASLDASVLVGVGAAFNFEVGDLSRAPTWMQRLGLEWLFRLISEPRRLWRRYFFGVPRFCLGVLRHSPRAVDA